MGIVGAGAEADWHCGGDGDGSADGGVLPSGNHVCCADKYVFRAVGCGAGPDCGGDVLCSAGESLGGDTAGCSDRAVAARSDGGDRTSECSARGGSASSRTGVVGGFAGRAWLGFLLLGGSTFAWVGLGCCGGVTGCGGDGAVARARGEFTKLAGGGGD